MIKWSSKVRHHIAISQGSDTQSLCGITESEHDCTWYGADYFFAQKNECSECLVIAGLRYDVNAWRGKKGRTYSISGYALP